MIGMADGLAAAQDALARGDTEAALSRLAGLSDPPALHLRSLALRRAGRLDEARRSFEAALAAAPHDPQVANNFANLLRQTGDREEALRLYDRALTLEPTYRDAAFNKALLLSDIGDERGALALLERLSASHPVDAPVHSSLGAVLRRLGNHEAAAAAFDAALGAQPTLPTALKGRAQVALERGESDASERYRRAVAADPADLGTVYGYAEALEADGRGEATAMLEQVLQARPDWTEGHALLARMRAERGEPDFASGMRDAARRNPADRRLALALAGTLAAAERWDDALAALPSTGDDSLAGIRAYYLCEAGRPAEALALIEGSAEVSAIAIMAAARSHLRLRDPEAAAAILERAVAGDPRAIGAWGLLGIAWRLVGDARAEWLSGQDGLVAARDIGMEERDMVELAMVLRQLHRTRAHPIGQSLRGGTQTRGALLLRSEPILARLRAALSASVAGYLAALPPVDDGHPLLRHREARLAIGGSWSVRLTGAGFHVNHIHPQGVISSACYIALPDSLANDGARAGWLELGRPPAELGVDLPPLAVVEPRVGRLALFPSYLFHGTRPFSEGERLTVAFDMVVA